MNAWDIALLQPLINVLIAISHYLFNNFGITIIVLTLIIRFILLPLTLRQLRSSKKMQDLQPQLAELQKKYAKDKQKLAQEQMKLYKESGVNAAGCALTMIIQFPIWIALYQSIILALAFNPEALLNLSRYLYSWAVPLAQLPFNPSFLGVNLAVGNPVLAVLVGITHVGAAKDGDAHQSRPAHRSTKPNDAVDDAADVHLLQLLIPGRSGNLLAGLQPVLDRCSIFRHRLGRFEPQLREEFV